MSEFDLEDPRVVEVYDDLPLWSAACGQLLLDAVSLRTNLKVLDVGCGTGFPLVELAERLGPTCEVTGIDCWGTAVERARLKILRRQVSHASVRMGDASQLPFGDAEMDLVVSNLGLNNFASPELAMRECRRVAKPGAEIVLATNVEGTMAELYAAYRAALANIGVGDGNARVDRLISERTSKAKLHALLIASGFEIERETSGVFTLRFLDSEALFRHSFMRLAFVDGWGSAVEEAYRERAMAALAARLDDDARAHGGVTLTVPIVCVVGRAFG